MPDSDGMFEPLSPEGDNPGGGSTGGMPLSDWVPILPIPLEIEASLVIPWHSLGRPDSVWQYWGRNRQLLFILCRFNLQGGSKAFRPLTFCAHAEGRREWRWQGVPTPRPLYGLDRLDAFPNGPVLVAEGEKAVSAAMALFPDFVAVTSPNGARSAAMADWSPLAGRRVVVWPDHDDEGRQYAATVTRLVLDAGAVSAAIVAVPDHFPEKWDLADPMPNGWTVDELRKLLEGAEPVSASVDVPPNECDDAQSNDDAEIAHLAALPRLDYDRARDAAAARLGVRVSSLDRAVVDARRTGDRAAVSSDAMFPVVLPWPDPVVAMALLDEIRQTVQRFIICTDETATVVALWCAFTWFIDRVQVAPILVITAPEKRCGKSQLLDLVGRLSYRPLVASNISPAAVYRVIEAHGPTLLLDESDSFMRENEELRGVINSGHTRQSAYVVRTVGDEHEPTRFSTWGAKALAGIGHLAETIRDRAVVIELRRKLPNETTERLRHAEAGLFDRLREMLARFAADAGDMIARSRPLLPDELNDRAQDNWEPLLAIADHAGGHWPANARAAALKLSGADHEAKSLSAELLADTRDIFQTRRVDKMTTAELLHALNADHERPWSTYGRGTPMTPRHLAKLLGEYGIASQNQWLGTRSVKKGFSLAQFEDAFARYLSSGSSETSALPLEVAENPNETMVSGLAADSTMPLDSVKCAMTPGMEPSGIADTAASSGKRNRSAMPSTLSTRSSMPVGYGSNGAVR